MPGANEKDLFHPLVLFRAGLFACESALAHGLSTERLASNSKVTNESP
jgi:hypothetical protein